jgi:hypothetical protein
MTLPIKSKNFLQRKSFILIIVMVTMLNNLAHNANVYYDLVAGIKKFTEVDLTSLLHAYAVVVVMDISILAFITNKEDKAAIVFAWILFIVNMIYWEAIKDLYKFDINDPKKVSVLLSKLIWSGVFSYAIHKFSTLYVKMMNEEAGEISGASELEVLKNENSSLKLAYTEAVAAQKLSAADLEKSEANLQLVAAHIKDYEALKLQLEAENTCEHCGEIFKNRFAKNGHQNKCEKKPAAITV